MNEKMDLRGLPCPEPVIAAKKALDRSDIQQVQVLVDDEICVSNLQRLAGSLQSVCFVETQAGFFQVTITKSGIKTGEHIFDTGANAEASRNTAGSTQLGSIVFITREKFGDGDPEFSKTLSGVFLQSLYESGQRPQAILLANSGVKLMSVESETRKVLQDFSAAGCAVLCCGLCVEYYGLSRDISKEQITNMFAICQYLTAAEKILQF